MIITLAGQFKQLSHVCTGKISGVFNRIKPKTSVLQVQCSYQLGMGENQSTSTCIAYTYIHTYMHGNMHDLEVHINKFSHCLLSRFLRSIAKLLIQVSMHAHFIAFLKNKLVD